MLLKILLSSPVRTLLLRILKSSAARTALIAAVQRIGTGRLLRLAWKAMTA